MHTLNRVTQSVNYSLYRTPNKNNLAFVTLGNMIPMTEYSAN